MVHLEAFEKGVWEMSYKLYPFRDMSRLPEVCSLFAKGLSDTTVDYWRWKHYSDSGHPEGMILVAEADDGSLAGMFALQPERYQWGKASVTVVKTEDLVIDPAHRGSGLMKQLYQYAVTYYEAKGYWGFVAFTNENSYPIFLKYGAKDMGDISGVETGKRILPLYPCRTNLRFGDWTIRLTGQMPDDLFWPVRDTMVQMEKSRTFMEWKFVNNPEKDFHWLTIRKNGTLQGYLVVSITQGRFRRAVNICDWAFRENVDASVIRCAVKLLLTHGNWVELWGCCREEDRQLWAEAGLNRQSSQKTHFLLAPFQKEEYPTHWHLTRADLDY